MLKVVVVLFLLLFFPNDIKAIYDVTDVRCTNALKTNLKQEAQDITYRLSKVKQNNDIFYTSYMYNVTDKFEIVDSKGNKYDREKINNLKPGSTLTLNIYASNMTYCSGYKVMTKIIKVPEYNPYYGSDLCVGYEHLSLCLENEKVLYSEEEFVKQIKKYSNKTEEKEEKKNDEYLNNIDEYSVFDIFVKYKDFIFIGLVTISVGILIYIVIKRNKNKGIL